MISHCKINSCNYSHAEVAEFDRDTFTISQDTSPWTLHDKRETLLLQRLYAHLISRQDAHLSHSKDNA